MAEGETGSKSILIGIIIFIMLSLSGIGLINLTRNFNPDLLTAQEGEDYGKLNKTFQKLDEVNTSVMSIQDSITNTDNKEFGVFGVLGGLINSAWNTLRLLFTGVSFMSGIFDSFTEFLGFPTWVSWGIMAIISIIISFEIFKSIFKT